MLRSILFTSLLAAGLFLTGCGPTNSNPATPAAPTGPTADTVDPKDAIGKCAADVKDGHIYGKIVSIETDLESGNKMVKIDGGGASWNKNAKNIRVVDCK